MHFAALRRTLAGAVALAVMTLAPTAYAAAPVYEGSLGTGGSANGSALPDSGPFGTPERWDFWTLTVPFSSDRVPFAAPVTITVRRLTGELDPVIGVWFGQEADVASYFDMMSASLNTTWIASGDDELPANVSGPGGDARVSFIADLPGTYVIGIADHTLDATAADGLAYQITAAIPEPQTYALMLAGIGLVGAMAAKRRRAQRS